MRWTTSLETLRTRTATSSFGERTLRLARPHSARHLLTLLARLRKADGYRLLSALDGLAAAPALERPLFAPAHGACNILGSALAVSSCHVRSPLWVRTHGTGASSCLKPTGRDDEDAAGRTAPTGAQCSAQNQLRVPRRASMSAPEAARFAHYQRSVRLGHLLSDSCGRARRCGFRRLFVRVARCNGGCDIGGHRFQQGDFLVFKGTGFGAENA